MAVDWEKRLEGLKDRVEKALGDRLVSLVLYGSAVQGDQVDAYSDLNVLCILSRLGPEEIRDSGPFVHWWRTLGNPSPLLLSAEELRTSTDCFPMEFHDVRANHRILAGEDLVAGLRIDERYFRGLLEHELRAKLIRLRQKAAGVAGDGDLLLRLMAESLSTFLTLGRHALRLAGAPSPQRKRETLAALAEVFRLDAAPFYTLLDLREGTVAPRQQDPAALFAAYLTQLGNLVTAVDRIQDPAGN